jgi:hypothetical protein
MITYTWRITSVGTEPLYDNTYEDFVSSIQYQYWGTDENGDMAYLENTSNLLPNPDVPYIARADLTDDIAISWVVEDLGPEQLAAMEAEIADMLAHAPKP